MVALGIQIICINRRRKLNLFYIDSFLIFTVFFFTLCNFKLIFAVVHYLAHRRLGVCCNFHQIQTLFACQCKRLSGGHNPELLTVGRYNSYLCIAYFLVDLHIFVSYDNPSKLKLIKLAIKKTDDKHPHEKDSFTAFKYLPQNLCCTVRADKLCLFYQNILTHLFTFVNSFFKKNPHCPQKRYTMRILCAHPTKNAPILTNLPSDFSALFSEILITILCLPTSNLSSSIQLCALAKDSACLSHVENQIRL